MHRSITIRCLGFNCSSSNQQFLHERSVPGIRGKMQRGPATFCDRVDIGAAFNYNFFRL
jgi:hypothetical protein